MRIIGFVVFFLSLALSNQTLAHTRWALDGLVKPRTDVDGNKTGPCGAPRTTNRVTELVAGSKVQVKFESVIFHKGVFRISFSAADDKNFILLADNIKDFSDQRFQTLTLTLPSQPCNKCTLQLIQTMPDSGNSLYYSCADIKLTSPTTAPDTTPPAAITKLTLKADTQTIRLSWQNPAQDYAQTLVVQSTEPLSEYPQAGIEYRQATTLGNGKVVVAAAQTEYTSPQLAAGANYYYTLFAVDTSRNYSALTQIYGQLAQVNRAPTVALLAEQAGQIKQTFLTTAGLVTLQARVTDVDTSDRHEIDWAGTDSRLVDLTANDPAFSFNPSSLKPGNYKVVVTATDSGTPKLSARTEMAIVVEEPATLPPVTQPPVTAPPVTTPPTTAGALSWQVLLLLLVGLPFVGVRFTEGRKSLRLRRE